MTNLTFDWQIDEFMVYCQSKQLRPKSMASYEQTLRLFQRWCKDTRQIENVDEVKENDIRRYITDVQQRGKYTFYVNDKKKKTNHPEHRRDFRQKVSVGTINNYIRNLKVFFNWLDESYVLKKNPMACSIRCGSMPIYRWLVVAELCVGTRQYQRKIHRPGGGQAPHGGAGEESGMKSGFFESPSATDL